MIVLLRYEDVPVLEHILRAWVVDPGTRQFVPIDTSGIACNNDNLAE